MKTVVRTRNKLEVLHCPIESSAQRQRLTLARAYYESRDDDGDDDKLQVLHCPIESSVQRRRLTLARAYYESCSKKNNIATVGNNHNNNMNMHNYYYQGRATQQQHSGQPTPKNIPGLAATGPAYHQQQHITKPPLKVKYPIVIS